MRPNYKGRRRLEAERTNDVLSRGPLVEDFNDDVLDGLESQIDISNQNVKAAEAAFEQSRALVSQALAGFWPRLRKFRVATPGSARGYGDQGCRILTSTTRTDQYLTRRGSRQLGTSTSGA